MGVYCFSSEQDTFEGLRQVEREIKTQKMIIDKSCMKPSVLLQMHAKFQFKKRGINYVCIFFLTGIHSMQG